MMSKIRKKLRKISIIYIPYRNFKIFFVNKIRNIKLHNKGYQLLNEVCSNLKKTDISFFCAYGTLLGFVRDGGFIKHDLDIDMGILNDEKFNWDILDEKLKEIGMNFDHGYILDNGFISEKTYKRDGVSIDFFLYNVEKENMFSYVFFKKDINDTDFCVRVSYAPIVNQINFKKIGKVTVPIISNYNEYLERVYGKNWKVPDPNYKPEINILNGRTAKHLEVVSSEHE